MLKNYGWKNPAQNPEVTISNISASKDGIIDYIVDEMKECIWPRAIFVTQCSGRVIDFIDDLLSTCGGQAEIEWMDNGAREEFRELLKREFGD